MFGQPPYPYPPRINNLVWPKLFHTLSTFVNFIKRFIKFVPKNDEFVKDATFANVSKKTNTFWTKSSQFGEVQTLQKNAKSIDLDQFCQMRIGCNHRGRYTRERAFRSFSKIKDLGDVLIGRVRGHISISS